MEQLSQETKDGDLNQKIVVYQKANKEVKDLFILLVISCLVHNPCGRFMKYWFTLFQVAIICNHQRTVSKSHGAQIEKLTARIEELKVQIS